MDSQARIDGPTALGPFDWDGLEKRFEAKMVEFGKEEEELWTEFRGWIEVCQKKKFFLGLLSGVHGGLSQRSVFLVIRGKEKQRRAAVRVM